MHSPSSSHVPLGIFALAALCAAPLIAQPQQLITLSPALPINAGGDAVLAWAATQRDADGSIGSVQFVRVDTTALWALASDDAAATATYAATVFGVGAQLDLSVFEQGLDHTIFHGTLRSPDGRVMLAVGRDGAIAGEVELADQTFEIAPTGVGSIHALLEINAAARARLQLPCGCAPEHQIPEHRVTAEPLAAASAPPVQAAAGPTTIDVMVFYTPTARARTGGTSAIRAQIAFRVGKINEAAANSGVAHRVRLVHTAETAYTETGTTTDLSRFRSPNDGYMDEVHQLRDVYGGDLMALIIERSSQFCGVGYLMQPARSGFRSNAFSVTVRTCLGGNTLTHELGHNMGCAHDRANASSGAFSYSFGYRTPDNRYRTIMAYSPGSRVNKWSSPFVRHNGYTMGTTADDNARSLNNVKDIVASFWATRVYDWQTLSGGIAGLLGRPTPQRSGHDEPRHPHPGHAGQLSRWRPWGSDPGQLRCELANVRRHAGAQPRHHCRPCRRRRADLARRLGPRWSAVRDPGLPAELVPRRCRCARLRRQQRVDGDGPLNAPDGSRHQRRPRSGATWRTGR